MYKYFYFVKNIVILLSNLSKNWNKNISKHVNIFSDTNFGLHGRITILVKEYHIIWLGQAQKVPRVTKLDGWDPIFPNIKRLTLIADEKCWNLTRVRVSFPKDAAIVLFRSWSPSLPQPRPSGFFLGFHSVRSTCTEPQLRVLGHSRSAPFWIFPLWFLIS